jgi:hypothetical protein
VLSVEPGDPARLDGRVARPHTIPRKFPMNFLQIISSTL